VPENPADQSIAPAERSSGMSPLSLLLIALGGLVVLFGPAVVVIALLLSAAGAAREAVRQEQCAGNLKQIALAMQRYHERYGCFPPAYLTNEDGEPAHSWRVLILPFLEQGSVYNQYSFDDRWDSVTNRIVFDVQMPVYGCPGDDRGSLYDTSYMMVVGPGMLSDGSGWTTMRDISDGTSNTIMIVEVARSGTHWAKPGDLNAEEIGLAPDRQTGRAVRNGHPAGVNAVFCDGSVRMLPETTAPEDLRAMATIAGGEPLPGVLTRGD
jgi:prepilin-type processing-associated H-X9-DG protein